MKKVKIILITISFLLLSAASIAAEIRPYFGISGVYPGSIEYKGHWFDATLELVQFGDTVRGFINTEIEFIDDSGHDWQGTSIFVVGTVSEDNQLSLRMTDHQCAAIAQICALERQLSTQSTFTRAEVSQQGPDFVLYKIDLPSLSSLFPFSSATFEMDSTYAAVPPDHSNPYHGIWDLIGYGANHLLYPTTTPVFDANLALFRLGERDIVNIFIKSGGYWIPANEFLGLRSSNPEENRITLQWLWWKYEIQFSAGFAFGHVGLRLSLLLHKKLPEFSRGLRERKM